LIVVSLLERVTLAALQSTCDMYRAPAILGKSGRHHQAIGFKYWLKLSSNKIQHLQGCMDVGFIFTFHNGDTCAAGAYSPSRKGMLARQLYFGRIDPCGERCCDYVRCLHDNAWTGNIRSRSQRGWLVDGRLIRGIR